MMWKTPMDLSTERSARMAKVCRYSRQLEVEVYDISQAVRAFDHEEQTLLMKGFGATPYPMGPTEKSNCFCSMGDPEKQTRGSIWTVPSRSWKHGFIGVKDEWWGERPSDGVISALLHELSHTLVGEDEVCCTVLERQICRLLFPSDATLISALERYAPDNPDSDQVRYWNDWMSRMAILPLPDPRREP